MLNLDPHYPHHTLVPFLAVFASFAFLENKESAVFEAITFSNFLYYKTCQMGQNKVSNFKLVLVLN